MSKYKNCIDCVSQDKLMLRELLIKEYCPGDFFDCNNSLFKGTKPNDANHNCPLANGVNIQCRQCWAENAPQMRDNGTFVGYCYASDPTNIPSPHGNTKPKLSAEPRNFKEEDDRDMETGNGKKVWKGSFRGELSYLSNMHPAKFVVDGMQFSSAEQYFVWASCEYAEDREKILAAQTPVEAKKLGKTVTKVAGWREGKQLEAMRTAVYAKFSQNEDLAKKLIDTGTQKLEERNTWFDKYWGVDWETGEGANHLGKILMDVREQLKLERETSPER